MASAEIVEQLERASIHSSDIREVQDDKPTSELRSRKKRKITLRIPESVKKELMPPRNPKELKQFILVHLPILSWVWSYQPKFLIGDLIAGITVSVMHIPQGMAYAALAELPPVYGLYTSFMAPMIYAVFGTSRHVSLGVFAIVSLMVGGVVRRTIDANPSLCTPDPTGNDTVNDNATATGVELDYPDCPASVEIAITMAFLSALFMLLFGLLRLGFMTTFLSEPLVSGYTTGAAVHVFTSQLRHLVGVPSSAVRVDPGVFALPRIWAKLVGEVVSGRLNWAAVVVSVLCIIFLVLVRLLNKQLGKFPRYKKLPIPIPSQLIAVIVATLISTLVKLDERYDIDVVGELPTGAPPLRTPKLSHAGNVIIDSFIAVVVCYSVTLSLEKVFAKKHGYTIHPNQEFLAFGIMNLVGSFFSCFNAAASLSRSLIQDATGGRTQAVAFVSSSILLVVLLALGPLFERLPRAILSAIIVVALQRMFVKVTHIKKYYQLSIPDMFIWIVVFLATVFLGVDIGLGVGVGFAMLLVVVRTVVPVSNTLGKDDDHSCSYTEDGNEIPGVLIFRFISPLCFTNAQLFMSRLATACNIDPEKRNSSSSQPGCIEVAYHKLNCCTHNKGTEMESQPTHNGDVHNDKLNIQNSNGKSEAFKTSAHQAHPCWCPDLHYIIIDMSPVTFIDSCGSKMLERVRSDYSSCGIQLVLAATSKHNIETLEYSGFVNSLGVQWFLPSIQAAVDFIEKHRLRCNTEDIVKYNSTLPYDETSI